MTKKHFIALAKAMNAVKPDRDAVSMHQWLTDCRAIALTCADSNPRFNYHTFMAACGVEVSSNA